MAKPGTSAFYEQELETAIRLIEQQLAALDAEVYGAISKKEIVIPTDEFINQGILEVGNLLRRPHFLSICSKNGWKVRKNGDEVEIKEERVASATQIQPGAVAAIDPDYFFFPKWETKMIEVGLKAHMNVFAVGPTGTGKTTLIRKILERQNRRYLRMNLNGEVSVDDFVGVHVVRETVKGNPVTEFVHGILPRCMSEGMGLLIDELDAAPPEILFILQAVLEGAPLVITKNAGEVIESQPGFLVGATANTTGKGDESGQYAGTNTLNEAFLDRWGMVVQFDYIPEPEEIKVLKKRTGVHEKIAEVMVQIANLARQGVKEGDMYSTFSTRKCLNWATLVAEGVSLQDGFKVSALSKVGQEDQAVLCEIFQRIIGEDVR